MHARRAGIAGTAHQYGALSETALIRAVDFWVHKFDPIAVIRSKAAAKDRYIDFGDRDDPDGVVSFWGRMRTTDAAISDTRLNDLARGVCDADPRTVAERRADALAAVLAGADRLTCLCGNPDCAGSGKDPRAGAVTIYVLTGQEPDSGHGVKPGTGPTPEPGPVTAAPDTEDVEERQESDTATPPEAEPQPPSTPAAPTAPAARTRLSAGIHPGRRDYSGPPARRPHRRRRQSPTPEQRNRPGLRTPLPPLSQAGRLRPHDRHDLLLPRLRKTCPTLRHRPCRRVAGRGDPPGQPAPTVP
ncbi:DUF222 domain-containing protein [Mycolicibacterium neoaurum]|nr:DUF222 domain-containing protein [Mycolicibacterium neoaurum]WBP94631.1 DUF222 domain-containing protein [Mycolicibacterium neoaurum]